MSVDHVWLLASEDLTEAADGPCPHRRHEVERLIRQLGAHVAGSELPIVLGADQKDVVINGQASCVSDRQTAEAALEVVRNYDRSHVRERSGYAETVPVIS